MNYPLTITQERILQLSRRGHHWTGGDDNDFSCLLSEIATDFVELDKNYDAAWSCFQNDPLAVRGVRYDQFCDFMDTKVKRRREDRLSQEAHARAMERAG